MDSILNRIRLVITHSGLSDTAFAKSISVPQATFSNMYQRESEPKPSWLEAIVNKYGIDARWLLTGEGDMFSGKSDGMCRTEGDVRVPVLSQKVSCGPGTSWDSEQNITEYISLASLSPALTGKLYGFRVSGTSMLGAGIKDGDIVIFNASPEQHLTDGIYVFSLDGDAYCKRLEFDRLANRIKIYSVRVADLEKAELLRTLDSTDEGFPERFRLFGRVFSWLHMARQ